MGLVSMDAYLLTCLEGEDCERSPWILPRVSGHKMGVCVVLNYKVVIPAELSVITKWLYRQVCCARQ